MSVHPNRAFMAEPATLNQMELRVFVPRDGMANCGEIGKAPYSKNVRKEARMV